VDDATQLIVKSIDDLKHETNRRLSAIETILLQAPALREGIKNQWYHITAIWTAISTLAYFLYDHVKGLKN
jgi:hypothetical protein